MRECRRVRCAVVAAWIYGCIATASSSDESHVAVSRTHRAMGTEFVITVYARESDPDAKALGPLLDEVFEEIDRIEALITTWRPDSQVMYLNRNAAERSVRVSSDVIQLVLESRRYFDQTGGAFDCSIGPLSRLYGLYDEKGRQPPEHEIATALGRIGMEKVRADVAASTVAFDTPGMELEFGGIGKGFAVDRAIDLLKRRGISRALVDGGTSSLYALGAPPGERGWTVRIRHPYNSEDALAEVVLKDESLSTSGCYDLDEVDGRPVCNIFDPRTGRPLRGMLSASAIAPTATQSDALSTGFLVMGIDETRAFRVRHPEVRAILVPETPGAELAPVWIGDGEPPWNHGSTQ